MQKGIIHFEDSRVAAELFREHRLKGRLQDLGKGPDIQLEFVSYLRNEELHEMRSESEVADDAFHRIKQHGISRLALVTDLDARGGETLEVEYGFRVLKNLSAKLGEDQNSPPHVLSIQDMFDIHDVLVVLLTLAPRRLIEKALRSVCGIEASDVRWVSRDRAAAVMDDIKRSLTEVNERGLKIVLANRAEDEAWLAALLAKWI